MNQLEDKQLETFDQDYMSPERWNDIRACIDSKFNSGSFNFLDIGGGNGMFADRLLKTFPNSKGGVLDNSKLLLEKNTKNERKKIIYGDITDEDLHISEKYDIIFFNWVLHHLVARNNYLKTKSVIRRAIEKSKNMLSPEGRISIF